MIGKRTMHLIGSFDKPSVQETPPKKRRFFCLSPEEVRTNLSDLFKPKGPDDDGPKTEGSGVPTTDPFPTCPESAAKEQPHS